jgi:hypothetical protein
VAAVIAIVSPSQRRPAVIQRAVVDADGDQRGDFAGGDQLGERFIGMHLFVVVRSANVEGTGTVQNIKDGILL